MIKDKPIKILKWFFTGVEKYVLRHFSKVSFLDVPELSQDKAAMVLMNHFSFNDGAILHQLCRKILHRQFKVMVVEDQLRDFILLKYAGCFSINKRSRSIVESLNYAAEQLNDPGNMLGIFPQGQVYSTHLNQVHFEKGLEKILDKAKKPIQLIFAVALLDYLDSFKPHARIYLKEYRGLKNIDDIEKAYNEFYLISKKRQRSLHNPPADLLEK
jgi:1-acyl-sn-glycerol-3-phosphate acyltransferase